MICQGKGSVFYNSNYASQVLLIVIRTAELNESDPFMDIEEVEDELKKNELVDYA